MDEQIRDAILHILHKAYRNPRGRYRHVTFPILYRDVKDSLSCEREDVLRELQYLMKKKLVDLRKERYAAVMIGRIKRPGGYATYYELSGSGIDIFEKSEKYGKIRPPVIPLRHKVNILKSSDDYQTALQYPGDFQPQTCFLPIDANVEEGDKIQLMDANKILDEKVVGKVDKYFGGPGEHIEIQWADRRQNSGGGATTLNISDSTINAPIAAGVGNTISISVSYNSSSDIEKILHLIDERASLDEEKKAEVKQLVRETLPQLLENPDLNRSKSLTEKLKGLGQDWLVPVITQVVAAYFQHKLGI